MTDTKPSPVHPAHLGILRTLGRLNEPARELPSSLIYAALEFEVDAYRVEQEQRFSPDGQERVTVQTMDGSLLWQDRPRGEVPESVKPSGWDDGMRWARLSYRIVHRSRRTPSGQWSQANRPRFLCAADAAEVLEKLDSDGWTTSPRSAAA